MADSLALRPSRLAHVVFRTGDLPAMLAFWKSFLGAEVAFESEFMVFLRYDEEHHRVALIKEEGVTARPKGTAGLHHVAFTYSSLRGLCEAYKARSAMGIESTWCVNHGPTTSIYYKDPDGNAIETQADNFDTVKEANDFMASELFKENPIGTDIDPLELLNRLDSGDSEKALKRRVEIGARIDIPSGV
ncbi:Glyoxalase/Bleomycin resistance protein/Dihydroxybiphenyl dioxygenase [Trichoderma sp. SZMC 28014]